MFFHDSQTSFAGGEAAPDIQARVDIDKYKTFAKTLRNLIPNQKGIPSSRPGSLFVAEAKHGNMTCRIIPLSIKDVDYILEFGDGYVRFYRDGAQIMSAGVPYEIVSPYTVDQLSLIKHTQSADILYMVHPDVRPKTLARTSDTNWAFADYGFENGPFRFPNTDTSITMTKGFLPDQLVSSSAYFVAGMANSVFEVDQFMVNGQMTAQLTGTQTGVILALNNIPGGVASIGTLISYLACGSTWRLITTGDWVGTLAVQQSIDGGVTWETIQSYKSDGSQNFNTFGAVDISVTNQQPYLIRANMLSHSSGTLNVTLTADAFTFPRYFITGAFIDSTHMTIVSDSASYLGAMISSFNWSEGAWSVYWGWPHTVTFFQDRLAFGGNAEQPDAVWLTKSSDYTNFGRSSPLVDSDGITVTLLSRQLNSIKNMIGLINSLVVFTGKSYFTISATQDGAVTPTTVFQKLQEARGSANVAPVIVGNNLIFCSPGSTLRALKYDYFTNIFPSENVSVFSDHLIKNHSLDEIAYQQEQDSVIWMVRDDGKLLTLTYLKEQNVLTWAHHDTTGVVESIACIPGDDGDDVWMVVYRGSTRLIERIRNRTSSTDPADQYNVDAGVEYDGVGITELTGLDHLEGMTVAINAGGFVLPQQVVSGGKVTLNGTYTKVVAGLPYTVDVETLNPEIPMRDGTFQDRKYQINSCTIRFLNTVGGYVGPDLDTLDALALSGTPLMRDPSLAAATPTPLFSGLIKFPMRRNEEGHGRLCYRQVDPMPVTILGIYATVESGENP